MAVFDAPSHYNHDDDTLSLEVTDNEEFVTFRIVDQRVNSSLNLTKDQVEDLIKLLTQYK